MIVMHQLVVCARRYNGHELWTLLKVLHQRGHTFEVVSTDLLIKDELSFQPNTINRKVYDVSDSEGFDGISVVSGNMKDTEAYWTDDHVLGLISSFREADKIVSAICCSVPTLAPIVAGVRVSFFPLVRSRKRLQAHGAVLQTVSLSVDQKTVTAENQMITQMWGEEICNLLEGKPPTYNLTESGYTPKGRERRMPKEVREMIDSAREKAKQRRTET